MNNELDRALDLCSSFSPDLREIGRRKLEKLFTNGSSVAGVELAHIVVSETYSCSLAKPDAVKLLITELRLSGCSMAFLNLYHHANEQISDDLMRELLTLAAPNCSEAAEILDAALPGWKHPLL